MPCVFVKHQCGILKASLVKTSEELSNFILREWDLCYWLGLLVYQLGLWMVDCDGAICCESDGLAASMTYGCGEPPNGL